MPKRKKGEPARNPPGLVQWVRDGLSRRGRYKQSGLAIALNLHPSQVVRILQDKRRILPAEVPMIAQYLEMDVPADVTAFHFIPPCSPIRAKEVPAGDAWLHEVKFDGYRVQAHKVGSRVVIYSGNGHNFTGRFPSIAQLLHELPAKAAVLDGEVVASNADGSPNFARLHVRWARPGAIHLWAFDLLVFNGRDLRPQPLVKRQALLQVLLERFGCPAISLSETFEDGMALLRAAEQRGLEGVVSKRRDAPYRSGECRDWRKVKTVAWREANRERWRLFEKVR